MEKLNLLKFRPLATCKDFERVVQIIEDELFWFSKFYELNDPMEGVFTTRNSGKIKKIFSQKNKYVVCSFTDIETLNEPLFWAHYANGFRGIAIEIEITNDLNTNKEDTSELILEKIDYVDHVDDIDKDINSQMYIDKIVKKIINRKLIHWQKEQEYRFMREEDNSGPFPIENSKINA